MATAAIMPPLLKLKHNTTWSGVYTMAAAAAWTTMYSESSTQAYLFCGAVIDLSNMIAGDDIDIRVRKQITAGTWTVHSLVNYLNAQPANHPSIFIAPIPDINGVEISARQNVGALINLSIDVYDAKRLGLP